jgi:glycosyltransferase involved in cell wall biosynthesis/SAM-dependent methyltransferase
MNRKPLAVFTPLPPARSGIADYAAELSPYLKKSFDLIHVVADEHLRTAEDSVMTVKEFETHDPSGRVPRLYHVGNNPDHLHVFQEAIRVPGVVVLHDYLLHHLVATLTLGNGRPHEYASYLEHEYGFMGWRIAQRRFAGVFSEYEQFLMPLNARVLESARGVIVHSLWSESRIRLRYPKLAVRRIPHHLGPLPDGFTLDSRAAARRRLGIPPDVLVFASLGFITPPKQIDRCLRVFSRIRSELPPFRYLLVGSKHPYYSIDAIIEAEGLKDVTAITGYVDIKTFHDYIQAADIILNLRHPSAGETSGTLVRTVGMGRPAVVFDDSTFRDYPNDVVVKVPLFDDNDRALSEALRWLALDVPWRERLGQRAHEFVATEHAIERSAARYAEFISEALQTAPPSQPATHTVPSGWEEAGQLTEQKAAATVDEMLAAIPSGDRDLHTSHARRYVKTLQRIPKARGRMSLLELGSYGPMLPACRRVLGYEHVVGSDWFSEKPVGPVADWRDPASEDAYPFFNFNVEKDRFPFADHSFDVVLCCEVVEHLTCDPMFMMIEINRVLRFGGVLVLTTPNVASARAVAGCLRSSVPYFFSNFMVSGSTNRHNFEYATREISILARGAGFGEVAVTTEYCWSEPLPEVQDFMERAGVPPHLIGDNLFVVAKKTTEIVERYPPELYYPNTPRIRTSTAA